MASDHEVLPQHPVENLDQKENISLGNEARQHGARRRRRVAIRIRYPVVERVQAALNGQAHADNGQNYQHGDRIAPAV